jgi:hypothetical protein
MEVADAQRESRTVFLGGSVGQFVSAGIWFASASIATVSEPKWGFWALAIGGAAIFPLTQTILRAAGRQTSLSAQNPLGHLAMQVAFTVPIMVPVAAAAALAKPGWFYPACLVIVGAHYLPFVFLYGMKTYGFLAGSLIAAGYLIGLYAPQQIVAGGWAGAGILCVFACVLATVYRTTASRSA